MHSAISASTRWIQPRAIALALTFGLSSGLLSGPARAQTLTHDPFSVAATMQQIGKDGIEFGKSAQRWRETAQHYQQQLIRLQRLSFGRMRMEDSFPPRAPDYGIEDLCPGPARGLQDSLAAGFRSVLPKLEGNLVEEQQAICRRMVQARNAKYNESVSMLRLLIQRSQDYARIESQRDSVDGSQGALAANDNEAYRFLARNQLELDYWQARMRAYDDYIAELLLDHTRLARRALRGKQGSSDAIAPADVVKSALAQ